jgi:hypothetical protein
MSLPLATKGTLHKGQTTATKGVIWSGLIEFVYPLIHPLLIFRRAVINRIVKHPVVNRIIRHDRID